MIRIILAAACLALSGCGIVYVAPSVKDQVEGTNVEIVTLDRAMVTRANQSRYAPRQIPAVFSQSAGGGSGLRGAGALPEPVVSQQSRPGLAETRLPPETPLQPYTIGVGDVLVLATLQSATSIEELSGLLAAQNRRQGYTVQDDGAIAIPDVGRVQLADLSLEEAEAAVFQALVENQLDPTFSIEVSDFNSKRVTIGGAVQMATVVPITLTPLTLQEAIAAAGGVAVNDPEFVTIRLYREGTLYQLPLSRLPGTNIRLEAGDSVFVDTDYQLEKAQAYFEEQITLSQLRQTARTQALAELQAEVNLRRGALDEQRANFAAKLDADAVERDYVYLTGEVTTAGRFPLPFGSQASLADALFAQGGALPDTGNPREIYVIRSNPAGDVTAYHVDASNPVNLVLATQLEMRPNDILFVAQQPVTKWNRVVQQIVPSLILAGASTAGVIN